MALSWIPNARCGLLLVCAANSMAQSVNTTFVTGLAAQLQTMGLTSLSSTITTTMNNSAATLFLENINGTSKTLLAPNNDAFVGVSANVTGNATLLSELLSYHLLSGSFPSSAFANTPSHTIARTYLSDPNFVILEGNQTQVMVFSNVNNVTWILNQNTVVTVRSQASYENLLIQVIDAVVDTPGTLTDALSGNHLTALPQLLNQVNATNSIETTRGVTVFAPNDAAIGAITSNLPSLNPSLVQNLLLNHVINGTSLYSTLFTQGSYVSALGEPFTFVSNTTGSFVTSGTVTAKIVASDLIIQNGVVHVIDTVLFNTASNAAAASSAYMAATSSAAQGIKQTGGIGAQNIQTPTATGPIGKSTSKSTSIKFSGSSPLLHSIGVALGILVGAALVV